LVAVHRTAKRWRFLQKGFRERLLCFDCEQFLNDRYEKPLKAEWLDSPSYRNRHRSAIEINGLTYDTFKLCHLSVLCERRWLARAILQPLI